MKRLLWKLRPWRALWIESYGMYLGVFGARPMRFGEWVRWKLGRFQPDFVKMPAIDPTVPIPWTTSFSAYEPEGD